MRPLWSVVGSRNKVVFVMLELFLTGEAGWKRELP